MEHSDMEKSSLMMHTVSVYLFTNMVFFGRAEVVWCRAQVSG